MSQHVRRDLAERAVLEPIQRELLEPEAVELACSLIRESARAELSQVEGETAPAVAAIAAQIADLDDLFSSRDALAVTLRPVVAELREKMATLRARRYRDERAINWRPSAAITFSQIVRATYRDGSRRRCGPPA